MDLVLKVLSAQIEGNQELFVLTIEVVENARDQIFMRHILERKGKSIVESLVLHAQMRLLLIQVATFFPVFTPLDRVLLG